jgi:putative hydrolase of the HAD superfamily
MKIRALLFDLDDTLYGYAPCNVAGLAAAHAALARCVQVTPAEFRATHDAVRAELAHELSGQAASHNRALFFKRIVERRVGAGQGQLALELCDTYWRAFLATAQPSPHAHPVLSELRSRHALALVTNQTTDTQLRKLEALELEPYFTIVVTSEEAGVEKPDPRIFELALEALGVTPDEALMVGDSPEVDLRGALGLGLRCVLSREFVKPTDTGDAPDGTLATLHELPAWLAGRSDPD